MRRDVLLNSLEKILGDLQDSGVVGMLTSTLSAMRDRGQSDKNINHLNFGAISNYLIRVHNYDDTDRYILKVLHLDSLSDPQVWQQQINEMDPAFLFSNNQFIRNAIEVIPQIVTLLARDYLGQDASIHGHSIDEGMAVQKVILSDEGEALSSPQRVIELLNSISALYNVIAEVEQMPKDSLAIIGLDSGSEKSFDFLGIAKVMSELREILQWAYNTIAFHKQNVTVRNLQIAGETLNVVQKIGKLESTKALSSEEAQRLKHGLFAGLERFSSTGAYTPEMSEFGTAPALAMRPQPRLLTAPASEIIRESHDFEASSNEQIGQDSNDNPTKNPLENMTQEQIDLILAHLEEKRSSSDEQDLPLEPKKPRSPRVRTR